jgi:ATP-dependent helicase/DNAse subunit B
MDQDTFYLHLGTFAHDVFEQTDGKEDQFLTMFDSILQRQENITSKERVLFANLKDKLYEVARFNALHALHMHNPRMLQELEMTMHIDDHTVMKGFIDRTILVSDTQGNDYIALMDYKSGSEAFDEKLIPYGWSLQLPIYALMLQYHPELKDKQLIGVFIQHMISKKINQKRITIAGQSFPVTYQLDGVALNDASALSWFDKTVREGTSSFIQGVKQTKSGMYAQSKRLKTSHDLTALQLLAKQKIIEASQHIRARDYRINPIQVGAKSSCDHCPFIDVCFRHPKDVQRMTLETNDEAQDDELN